ncbi:3' terminal RNA ribose 2'-O-methyltransferase Hen1 [Aureibacillus halotolerans]|uniref:Small RNA 2'-O-methyltransferase n=1 Tax=Aureibacillus halotolerans TaxID=1508390 RepID=A0A4R6TT22_9BACI|nr:3' terminal RNA ribose 2'-O-methyltransferase Hen1 [Aureibacillus halotolerans]TDQ36236.1 3' terminal RNA ribose 2'-O-methyltransferase Hen1 [Aureibacillus halotolerans]
MQLTIKATGSDVSALSYLLAKNPANLYERKVKEHFVRFFFGTFSDTFVEATIFVTPDPLALVTHKNSYDITHYINDREFVASSIFCSLCKSALATALNGLPNTAYANYVDMTFPLTFTVGPIASGLSDEHVELLFKPLGYDVTFQYQSSESDVEKGSARMLTIQGLTTLQAGLRQLFVLLPVLDDYKHYYIDEKEMEKLERYGEGWLDEHPEKALIYRRALRFKELYAPLQNDEETQEKTPKRSLNHQRYEAIASTIATFPNRARVIDLGAGEGKLLERLRLIPGIEELLAVEPSQAMLLRAMKAIEVSTEDGIKPTLLQGSLFYYDHRLLDSDVIVLCEVIEHIDEERLPACMAMILDEYRPGALIITTPNKEYNQLYDMPEERRHHDHRFEWTRDQFTDWCYKINEGQSYDLTFSGIGDDNEIYGQPTQMCVFTRKEARL